MAEFWWKAACPLSGSDPRKRTFVQKVGQGGEGPVPGGKRNDRLRATIGVSGRSFSREGRGLNASSLVPRLDL